MKTYYVTRYALSFGIFAVDREPSSSGRIYLYAGATGLKLGRDCFETRGEAENDARARAEKRLKQLDNQRANLLKLAANPKWRK